MSLIDIVLNDYEITSNLQWAVDMDYSDNLNVLDITKLVYFILRPYIIILYNDPIFALYGTFNHYS